MESSASSPIRMNCTPTMARNTESSSSGVQFILMGLLDRKSTRLNSSHQIISYAPLCLKKNSSLGNEQWWHLYQYPGLTQMIHTPIAQNSAVRIAAAPVLDAPSQVGITPSNHLPSRCCS